MRRFASQHRLYAARVYRWLIELWYSLLVRQPAQGLVEYGLILVLIMVVCVAILTAVGVTVNESWYQDIVDKLPF
jgi:hypothetical protein